MEREFIKHKPLHIEYQLSPKSFTGVGGFTFNFPLPHATGFPPVINLAYSSGTGISWFGLGFSVSLDSIMRKTSTEILRYLNIPFYFPNFIQTTLPL